MVLVVQLTQFHVGDAFKLTCCTLINNGTIRAGGGGGGKGGRMLWEAQAVKVLPTGWGNGVTTSLAVPRH